MSGKLIDYSNEIRWKTITSWKKYVDYDTREKDNQIPCIALGVMGVIYDGVVGTIDKWSMVCIQCTEDCLRWGVVGFFVDGDRSIGTIVDGYSSSAK